MATYNFAAAYLFYGPRVVQIQYTDDFPQVITDPEAALPAVRHALYRHAGNMTPQGLEAKLLPPMPPWQPQELLVYSASGFNASYTRVED